MERRVARKIIDKWIEDNSPDGISRLAVNSRVSCSTIANIRRGHVPSKPVRRELAKTLKVSEDDLFPLTSIGAREAS